MMIIGIFILQVVLTTAIFMVGQSNPTACVIMACTTAILAGLMLLGHHLERP